MAGDRALEISALSSRLATVAPVSASHRWLCAPGNAQDRSGDLAVGECPSSELSPWQPHVSMWTKRLDVWRSTRPGGRAARCGREGRRLDVFFTKTYTRIVNPSLAELDPALPAEIAHRTPRARSWRAFEQALNDKIQHAALAA